MGKYWKGLSQKKNLLTVTRSDKAESLSNAQKTSQAKKKKGF